MYYGPPDKRAEAAELIFVGFWTDKGSCDSASAAFLASLRGKRVFLFGTAGFGGETSYFDGILTRIWEKVNSSNTLAGSYMCQGKMPATVRKRYEAMEELQPGQAKIMLENFDRALSHPDAADLKRLEHLTLEII